MSYIYGIGKVIALKVLKSGMTLTVLGQHDTDMDDVVSEATSFIAACYGSRTKGDLSEIRYTIWASKMANTKKTSAPKLKSLPPTNESFVEHVRRAQHQTAIWKGALSPGPRQMDIAQYGWSRGEYNSTLSPIMLPANVSPVPVDVLQMIISVDAHRKALVLQADVDALSPRCHVPCSAVAVLGPNVTIVTLEPHRRLVRVKTLNKFLIEYVQLIGREHVSFASSTCVSHGRFENNDVVL